MTPERKLYLQQKVLCNPEAIELFKSMIFEEVRYKPQSELEAVQRMATLNTINELLNLAENLPAIILLKQEQDKEQTL